jgi:inosine/xanthosine triphosphatase
MQTIIVGSRNPVKEQAVLSAFRRMFPQQTFVAEGVAVSSGVADQPMSDDQTLLGARNRMCASRDCCPQADYWVGIEGGIEDRTDGMTAFAWITVLSENRYGQARTATFPLPDAVAELIRQGVELGEANDRVFQRTNSKQHEGAIGTLSGQVVDRQSLYEHAAIMALLPFKNDGLYLPRTPDPSIVTRWKPEEPDHPGKPQSPAHATRRFPGTDEHDD